MGPALARAGIGALLGDSRALSFALHDLLQSNVTTRSNTGAVHGFAVPLEAPCRVPLDSRPVEAV